jgi:hypothetical protein
VVYLPFKDGGTYRAGSSTASSVAGLPGYSYSRSGAKLELDASGAPVAIAAASPAIIVGHGYYSRASLTNRTNRSQELDNAYWADSGTGTSSVTPNVATAPDGTATADRLTVSANIGSGRAVALSGLTIGQVYTYSCFVKTESGTKAIRAGFDNLAGSIAVTATATWQRVAKVFTATATTHFPQILNNEASAGSVLVWQQQVLAGDLPDGGPLIVTTVVAATIGADALSLSVPNGNYTATYTFDDGSSQVIATTVTGGIFTLPVHLMTLNRALLRLVTLRVA